MSEDGTDAGLLERIEAYFDAVPRSAADVEEHGALTLFVSRIPWRFYGRPRLGLAEDVGADDVAAVRARQRELGIAERFEWVHETTPSMAGAAAAAGLEVTRVPLLALDADAWAPVTPPPGITVRMLRADDAALRGRLRRDRARLRGGGHGRRRERAGRARRSPRGRSATSPSCASACAAG